MNQIISILYFIIVMFLLGTALSKKIHLMNFAYGFSIFAILALVFRLPVYWWLYLIFAVCLFLIQLVWSKFKLKIKTPSVWIILVLLITGGFFFVYHKGAFSYPWFEDGDPWHHAMGAYYVAESHTWTLPDKIYSKKTYLEPYPPTYDTIMALLYQLNGDMLWTYKFINVLLISFGLIFAFYFAEELFQSKKYAFMVTAGLALVPAFMSHFVWAQTLAVILIFPALYAMHRREYFIGGICIAGMLLTQPSTPVIFALCFFIPFLFIYRKAGILLSGIIGFVISLGYWIPTFVRFGLTGTFIGLGWVPGFMTTEVGSGSFGVKYGVFDFLFPKGISMIDQQVGIGIFICILVLFSFFFLMDFYKRKHFIPKVFKFAIICFILTLIGTLGTYFPINFIQHRFWVFLAVPTIMLAIYPISILCKILKKFQYPIIILSIILMIWTSGIPKYEMQTRQWPPGDSFGPMSSNQEFNQEQFQEELKGYLNMHEFIPKESAIFDICWDEEKIKVFGFNAPSLDKEVLDFRLGFMNHTPDEIYEFSKKKGFDYILITSVCLRIYSIEQMNIFLNGLQQSDKFKHTFNTQAFFLYRVS